eukprot:gene18485-24198_t
MVKVCIVGAGTVGLSVAYHIAQELSKSDEIIIIAENFYNETTSYGSGGLWEPYEIAGTPDELINYWGSYTFKHFQSLHYSKDAVISGVQLMTNYVLLEDHVVDVPSWSLGSHGLNNDSTMYPIRGQVLRVRAPWIKSVWFFGSSYIIPNIDNVVIGGTAQKGDWNTNASLQDTERIISGVAEIFPSIRDAPIESVWAGLRPGRTPLRLDSSVITHPDSEKSLLLVHCYGHGGSGITLAMGCAQDIFINHIIPYIKEKI